MKKNKKIIVLMVLAILTFFCFGGCGKKNQPENQTQKETGTDTKIAYNRARWIEDLSTEFGFISTGETEHQFKDVPADADYAMALQACVEWGVVPETDEFQPDKEVTWDFALSTSVNAIGLSDLEEAGYPIKAGDSLVEFYQKNIASVDIQSPNEVITADEAKQILDYAKAFWKNMELSEINEITFYDDVRQVTEQELLLRGDGESAYIVDGFSYLPGQVLLYYNIKTGEYRGLKIVAVEDNLIWYEEAQNEEIFSDCHIRGGYDPERNALNVSKVNSEFLPISATLAGTPNIGSFMTLEQNACRNDFELTDVDVKTSVGNGYASFTVSGDGWSIEAGIRNIKAWGEHERGKRVKAVVEYDDYVNGEIQAGVSQMIPLGTVRVPLGTTGLLAVQIDLSLNLGADGKATLEYTSHVSAYARYQLFKGIQYQMENQDPKLDFHGEISVCAEPTVRVSLMLVTENLINLKGTSGVVAVAKVDVDLLGKQPSCTDIQIYVPLRWALNEDSSWTGFLLGRRGKASGVIWDASNSPFIWHWHYENGDRTETCTRGTEEEIKVEIVDENGNPFDENEEFHFEEIDFATIKLESSIMFLKEDETLKIGFREIPGGQSTDSLIYEVVDTQGVCRINENGTITGLKSGATNVMISTSDGMYHAYITVIVQEDYSVDPGQYTL